MPEVPYKPVPSVTPTERKIPGVSVSFPQVNFTQSIGSALGELGRSRQVLGNAAIGVGAAIGSLGKSIEGAGDEIWNRAVAIKHVENQTAAVEADTKYMMESAQMDAQFQNQTGNAASGGLQAHMQALENKRQEIRGTLTNDDARHAYDQASLRTLGRTVFWAAHHAASQGKAAALGAATANFKMNLSAIENQADHLSPEDFEQRKQEIMDNYDRVVAPLEGLGKGPQAELRRKEITTQVEAARIAGLGKHFPDQAISQLKGLMDKNEILAPTALKLMESLESNRKRIATNAEVDRATSDLWDDTKDPGTKKKTEADRIKEAIDGLPEDIKDDPEVKKDVTRGVALAVRRQESAVQDYRKNSFYDLASQIYGPNGEIRQSPEALWAADPSLETKYKSLPEVGPFSKRSIKDAIFSAIKKDERIDPYISGQSLQYIRGLADHDQDSRDRLMDMNLYDKNLKDEKGNALKFNEADRRAAIRERDRLKRQPNGDPRVNRAWGWLAEHNRAAMNELGLLDKRNEDDIIASKGMLGDALDAYEAAHKGAVADYKAVTEDIGKQLLRHKVGSWWFNAGAEDPMYKTAIPSEKWKASYTADYKLTHGGQEPTESDIRHTYNQRLWKELFQGGGITTPSARPEKTQERAPEVGE